MNVYETRGQPARVPITKTSGTEPKRGFRPPQHCPTLAQVVSRKVQAAVPEQGMVRNEAHSYDHYYLKVIKKHFRIFSSLEFKTFYHDFSLIYHVLANLGDTLEYYFACSLETMVHFLASWLLSSQTVFHLSQGNQVKCLLNRILLVVYFHAVHYL